MDDRAIEWGDLSFSAAIAREAYRDEFRDLRGLAYAQFVVRAARRRKHQGREAAADGPLRQGLFAALREPHSRQQDTLAAREQLTRALEAYCELRDRAGEASAHLALAYVAQLAGDDQAEREHAEAALARCVEAGDGQGEADANFALGGLALRHGDDGRAGGHLTKAVELYDPFECEWPRAVANLWLAVLGASEPARRGLARWRSGLESTAELETALRAFHEVEPARPIEAAMLVEVAEQLRVRGKAGAGLVAVLAAVRLHDEVRHQVASAEGRVRLHRQQRAAYLLALELAALAQDGDAALEVSEAARSAVVTGLLRHGLPGPLRELDLLRSAVPDPIRELDEILRAVVQAEAEYAAADAGGPSLEHRLDEAYDRLRESIFSELGPAVLGWRIPPGHRVQDLTYWGSPTFARWIEGIARIFSEPGRLQAVRGRLAREMTALTVYERPPFDPAQLLPPHHALLCEVGVVDGRAQLYTVWAAPGGQIDVARHALDEEELSWIEGFAAGGREARLFDVGGRRFGRLGELLLPQGLRELLLAGAPEPSPLLVSPAGGLWKLPFAALRLEAGPDAPLLAERASLTYIPSLGARAVLDATPTEARGSGALGYFNPALHAAGIQRAALAEHLGPFQEVAAAADLPAALANAKGYALCVLAAHGDDQSGLSHSLDLGDGAALRAGELLGAALPPIVVLGACSSGSLALEAGDEPLGLPTAALVGGARTVLAALFPVPDRETAEILANAYAGIADGAEPAAALRAAQLAHIDGCAGRALCPPMHWAGCVAIGRG